MDNNINLTKLALEIAKEENDILYDDYERVVKALKRYNLLKQKLISMITTKYKNKCKRRMRGLD